jgi:hypothetical protein
MEFKEAVLDAVRSLDLEDRFFGAIQTELLLKYPEFLPDKGGKIIRRYDENALFEELKALQKSEGVILTSERLSKYIDLGEFSVRQREAFGDACRELKYLDDQIVGGTISHVGLLGGGERGYIFRLMKEKMPRTFPMRRKSMFVVKPYQGKDEKDVAFRAAETHVGPRVYGFGDHWMVEKYLGGKPLTCFTNSGFISYHVGNMFGRLHNSGIEYNHSHFYDEMIWTGTKLGGFKMVDYGSSSLGNDFSEDYGLIGNFLSRYSMDNGTRRLFFEEYKRNSGCDASGMVEF